MPMKMPHIAAGSIARAGRHEAGDTILFGHYAQSEDEARGQEPVEWIVLEADGERIVLISRYALDNRAFNAELGSGTGNWETCSLRKWLNQTFINEAFSPCERARLETVDLAPERPSVSSADGEQPARDRVSLLSIDEANRYFSSYSDRVCYCVPRAKAKGAYTDRHGACGWWLRSPGYSDCSVAYVDNAGIIDELGINAASSLGCVHPVIVMRA